jgi:hypothetical protein
VTFVIGSADRASSSVARDFANFGSP